MTKHDEIQMRIKQQEILNFVKKYFSEKAELYAQTKIHHIVNKELGDLNVDETTFLLSFFHPSYTFKELHSKIKESYEKIKEEIKNNNLIDIEYTKEHPLTKGEGQYKTTKGFLDLIIHAKGKEKKLWQNGHLQDEQATIHCFKNNETKEFIVEIKTDNDWNDLGLILRQIKEYETYYTEYFVSGAWNSTLLFSNRERRSGVAVRKPIMVICSDKIPDKAKEYFKENKIEIWELGEQKTPLKSEEAEWWYGDEN